MKKLLIVCIVSFLFFFLSKSLIADDTQYYVNRDWTPQVKLKFFTDKFNGNYEQASEVIGCESSWRAEVKGDGGKAFSYGQFHEPTFNGWAKEVKAKYNMDLYYENPVDSLALTAYAFGMPITYKDDWTCFME